MGWPEAAIVGFNVTQVLGLAYLALRQAQVKKALNGSADEVQIQLMHLHDLLAKRVQRVYRDIPPGIPSD